MVETLVAGDQTWSLDDEGHLADPSAWSEAFVSAMAEAQGWVLSDDHWWLIRWVRDYWLQYKNPPLMRTVVVAYRAHKDNPKLNSQALYDLFADHPIRQACLLGGVPKPDWCI